MRMTAVAAGKPMKGELPVTTQAAKALRSGQVLNILLKDGEFILNKDGTRARYKVTSVKKWKRRPEQVHVKVQQGLYAHHLLTHKLFDEGRVYIQPSITNDAGSSTGNTTQEQQEQQAERL